MTETVQMDGAEFTLGEGRGVAELDWWAAVQRLALRAALPLEAPTRRIALGRIQDLIGFWALWHLEGGGQGLERLGMSRATLYRKVAQFRESFGVHPDEFEFPGLTADPGAYLAFFGMPEGVDGAGMPRVLKFGRERPAKFTDE